MDRVAQTREARAAQLDGAEADLAVQQAWRARDRADVERHDDRELRRTWGLPDR
ncbi:hypothetical protein [Actinomycetospora sp. CA-084318]|uniref:hypothetical protein n=1 Tax=Actinomycetospora sp. CA-084318 TaxID=3239892 RepID=UPI003D970932